MFDTVSLRYPIVKGIMLSQESNARTSNTLDCIDPSIGFLPHIDTLREET